MAEPTSDPVIPAPGDAETPWHERPLHDRVQHYIDGNGHYSDRRGYATVLLEELLAESRRLAGEVAQLRTERDEEVRYHEASIRVLTDAGITLRERLEAAEGEVARLKSFLLENL